MNSLLRVALATFALVSALSPVPAPAEGAGDACPALPPGAGLRWEPLSGPSFVFCRALREDGSEAFAVTISGRSPFEPNRTRRTGPANVGGHGGYWYRSEIAGDPDAIARETLVELDDGKVAHVSLRAESETQLGEAMRQIGDLRFTGGDARLSSN